MNMATFQSMRLGSLGGDLMVSCRKKALLDYNLLISVHIEFSFVCEFRSSRFQFIIVRCM